MVRETSYMHPLIAYATTNYNLPCHVNHFHVPIFVKAKFGLSRGLTLACKTSPHQSFYLRVNKKFLSICLEIYDQFSYFETIKLLMDYKCHSIL